jgi:hypothetical protein
MGVEAGGLDSFRPPPPIKMIGFKKIIKNYSEILETASI